MKRLFAALFVGTVLQALGAGTDAALATRVLGECSLLEPEPAEVLPFMKLRVGDVVRLRENATLRLVYLRNGRQETWTGPARFEVGGAESQARVGKPELGTLPNAAPRGLSLAKIPDFLSSPRAGAFKLREGSAAPRDALGLEEVAAARRLYETWRRDSPTDELLPDLYYFEVLERYRLGDEMTALAAAVRLRAPGSVADALSRRAAAVTGQ